MILLYVKKCKHCWSRGRETKTPSNNNDEKDFPEGKTLSKLLRVSTKPIKNGKEILISKEKSASIITRYKTKLRIVGNLVKPKLAQKTET